jgi:hypothetical protein
LPLRVSVFLFVFLYIGNGFLDARIVHVPKDVPTIQLGIISADDGDTVMVAPGKYDEYEIDFLGKAITVSGTDPQDREIVSSTVVDANSQGRVFYFHSNETSSSILTGLTVTGGHTDYWGGGIRCSNSSPVITHNIIAWNSAEFGGGGIWCEESNPMITDNIIVNNQVEWGGGGIRCTDSSPVISHNIISENVAGYGGGIDCHYSSAPTIVNNVITANQAGSGGGIYSYEFSSPTITNTTITGNSVTYYGGGIMSKKFSTPVMDNSILWGNSALLGEEIFVGGSSEPSVITVSFSVVSGEENSVHVEPWCNIIWGLGIIESDPRFLDGAFHLQDDSPCIDTGDPSIQDNCRPPGLRSPRSDMGAYGGERNCWWPDLGLSFVIYPDGPAVVPLGETLQFRTYIHNYTGDQVDGDYWLSVLLPGSGEILIPRGLLNYPNPISRYMPSFSAIRLLNELQVPVSVETGTYSLIGRIGNYPNTIIDEESFDFQVIEGNED